MARPRKPLLERRNRKQIYVTDAEWARVQSLLERWRGGGVEVSGMGPIEAVVVMEGSSKPAAGIPQPALVDRGPRPVKTGFESPLAFKRSLMEWEAS